MAEGDRIKQLLLELPHNERLFRINAGWGWQGEILKNDGRILVLEHPRPFKAGPPGWLDLTGWHSKEITQSMVGHRVAQFKAIEVKLTGKLSDDQRAMRELIERMGGIVEVIRQ